MENKNSEKNVTERQSKILDLIKQNPTISQDNEKDYCS